MTLKTVLLTVSLFILTACGGGGSSGEPAGDNGDVSDIQTIAGTVTGLDAGKSVKLRLNSSETLTVSANGGFGFSTQLATGKHYAVTLSSQPDGQLCLVENSGGTVGNTAVTNINVICTASTTS